MKEEIIRNAYKRAGLKSDMDIARETGFPYDRLHRSRMKDIGSLTLNEFWLLQRHASFRDEEILAIAKEGEMSEEEMNRIKELLDHEPVPVVDSRIYLMRYLLGLLTGKEEIPAELIRYVLDKKDPEVQLI